MTTFLNRLIWTTLTSSVLIVPLFFSTSNSELFEVPKMLLTYLAAAILLASTLAKFVFEKKITLPNNLILFAFLAFLAAQTLAAFFSIDRFTSIYGFPSRLNGGIISLFAYFIIFTTALIFLKPRQAKKLLLVITLSALFVALWGIPSHFGKDPNCLVITGDLSSVCWAKEFDPKLRIFSTLGQPNWLASFMVLAIPVSLAFLTASKKKLKPLFALTALTLILALIFTGSVSGFAGVIVSLFLYAILSLNKLKNLKFVLLIFIPLILAVIFSTGMLSVRVKDSFSQISNIAKTQNIPQNYLSPNTPTPSWIIRIFIWQGAIGVFKNHPLLGTGTETFAYSLYSQKPKAHNLTSEWDFYYNKAHNEFLNYLANTGILGLTSYLFLMSAILYQLVKLAKNAKEKTSNFAKASISAVIGYHASIFFGFSVVPTQLFMFLITASTLSLQIQKFKTLDLNLSPLKQKTAAISITVVGLFVSSYIFRFYFADLSINRAKEGTSANTLESFITAIDSFPTQNPFYLADYAGTTAKYSILSENPSLSKTFTEKSQTLSQKALDTAPNNVLVLKKVINIYMVLSKNNSVFAQKANNVAQTLVKLAPTDPDSFLTLAQTEKEIGKIEDAQKTAQKALDLKPNYIEAQQFLAELNGNFFQ